MVCKNATTQPACSSTLVSNKAMQASTHVSEAAGDSPNVTARRLARGVATATAPTVGDAAAPRFPIPTPQAHTGQMLKEQIHS